MYNRDDRYENQIGRITCKPGWIEYVKVNDEFKKCGLGTVLSEMCMIDPELNKNDAAKNILFYKNTCVYVCDMLLLNQPGDGI